VALFGADTAVVSVCEAYCAGVGKKNFDHHHQTAVTFSSPHQHMHAQEHQADCPECPKTAQQSSLQIPDCGSFTRLQALQENSRIFFDDRAACGHGPTETEIGALYGTEFDSELKLLGLLREEKCFAAEILHERGLRISTIPEELAS
jgi:hypothetical protein